MGRKKGPQPDDNRDAKIQAEARHKAEMERLKHQRQQAVDKRAADAAVAREKARREQEVRDQKARGRE